MKRTPLRRNSPMPRPSKPMKRSEFRRTPRDPAAPKPATRVARRASRRRGTGPDNTTVTLILHRDGLTCLRCGRMGGELWATGDSLQIHHRRPRAMGGSRRDDTNLPSNLALLCTACHRWVESFRARALEYGYLVRQGHNPALVPLLAFAHGWVLLTPEGGYRRWTGEVAS